ncbi:MAG: PilZ domain-containing protein [Candidatus Methylomirabilales bacterium]
MKETTENKRRYIRWEVGGLLTGHIGHIPNVSVMNFSTNGALIEHSHLVRPGSLCFLTLSVPHEEFTLKCRVVRSRLHLSEVRTDGERDVIYRTGVEFLDTSEAARRLLKEYIESLKRMSRAARRTRARLNEPSRFKAGAAPTKPVSRVRKRQRRKAS